MIFVNNLMIFFGIVFFVIAVAAVVTIYRKRIPLSIVLKNGSIPSALLAIVLIAILSLVLYLLPNNANAGTWLNDAGVYMGLDYTRNPSPQCERADPIDNQGTSNLGLWANLWQSDNKMIRVNSKYTHHSCFIGEDANGYDGIGINVEWQLWKRK